ncbi:MAG: RHS repeat-associated core domain-containing protein [Bacteroidota bacterium]|nr:RHS repeat-associated core domain-containing protein [Bacteroidota bacterium]
MHLMAGYNFYSSNNNVKYRLNSGDWTSLADISVPDGTTDYSTLKAGLSMFIYNNINTSNLNLSIQPIKNGAYASRIDIPGVKSTYTITLDSWCNDKSELIGANTIVTYPSTQIKFEDLHQLTLHRFVDDAVAGAISDFPVSQITIDDKYETRKTTYIYDGTTALASGDGATCFYNKVRTTPGDGNNGYTDTYFFNGLTPDECSTTVPIPATDSYTNARDNFSLLKGMQYAVRSYNKSGVLVASTDNYYWVDAKPTANSMQMAYMASLKKTVSSADNIQKITENTINTSGQIVASNTYVLSTTNQKDEYNTQYKYAKDIYTNIDMNFLTDPVQTKTYHNGTLIGISSMTWKQWTTPTSTFWGQHKAYIKKTSLDSDFDFTSWSGTNEPPVADWIKVSEVANMDSHGLVTETISREGVHSAISYDINGTAISTFNNASSTNVFADDFNASPYTWSSSTTGWTVANGTLNWTTAGVRSAPVAPTGITSIPQTDFIAEFELRLPIQERTSTTDWSAFEFRKNNVTDNASGSGYNILIRQNGEINLYCGNPVSRLGYYNLTGSTFDDWQKIRVICQGNSIKVFLNGIKIIDVTDSRYSNGYIGFETCNTGVRVDNLRIYPLTAIASSKSYDANRGYLQSIKLENGDLIKYAYDAFGRQIGTINPKGITIQTITSSLSSDRNNGAYLTTDPNLTLNTAVNGKDGFYEDFETHLDHWSKIDYANGITSTWQLENGRLRHDDPGNGTTGSGGDKLCFDLGYEIKGRVVLELSVKTSSAATVNGTDYYDFGIAAGGSTFDLNSNHTYSAIWTAFKGYKNWQTYNGSWVNIASWFKGDRTYRLKIVMDVNSKQADYYIDGKLCQSNISFDNRSTNGISKIVLFNYSLPNSPKTTWYIDDIMVYSEPSQSVAYTDGVGKVRQTQVDEGAGQILVNASLYDDLGREYIKTKTTRVNSSFGYRTNFITLPFDANTGVMTGEVVTLNNNESYPYSRTVFEQSPLGRPVESGIPGATYKIGGGHTRRIQYTSEQGSDNFINSLQIITDENNAQAKEYKNAWGKTVKVVEATVNYNGANINPTISDEYDVQGNLVKIYPPNYYNPPINTSGSDYILTNTYDFLGQLTSELSKDKGTKEYIYDKNGRVRYEVDGYNTTSALVTYIKYDNLGRISETGIYSGTWSLSSLQVDSDNQSLPVTPSTWRRKYYYGMATTDVYSNGKLIKIETNNDADNVADVIETLGYDMFGHVVQKNITANSYSSTQTNSFSFEYDNAGNNLSITYPNATKILYSYDRLGRTSGIGIAGYPVYFASYSYDKNGQMLNENMYNNTYLSTYSYNMQGRLTMLNAIGDGIGFSEALSYENGGYGGSGYYNGQISKISVASNRGGAEYGYDMLYKYDNLGRLLTADNSYLDAEDVGVGDETLYDANGNMTHIKRNNIISNYVYYSGTNKVQNTKGIASNDYIYDVNGNVTTSTPKNIAQISYDGYFKKTQNIAIAGYNTQFQYGGDNERIYRCVSGTGVTTEKTLYLRGIGSNPLMEKQLIGTSPEAATLYVYGPTGIIAMNKANAWYFVQKNHLGSTRAMYDQNGNQVYECEYAPYGSTTNEWISTSISYKFTGQEYDASTGLHNFRARMYDSDLGMFYGVDPAGQGNAPFAYCGNNPVIFTDPDGQVFGIDDALAIAIGAWLGGSAANNWKMNPGDWKDPSTLFYAVGGGLTGWALYGTIAAGNSLTLNLGAKYLSAAGKEIASFGLSLSEVGTSAMYVSEASAGAYGVNLLYNRIKNNAVKGLYDGIRNMGNAAQNLPSKVWNSTSMRGIIPDFISLGVGYNFSYGPGQGTSIEFRWVTRGKDASFLPMLTMTQSVGGGYMGGITANIELTNYTGDAKDIERTMMRTLTFDAKYHDKPTTWGSLSVSFLGDVGLTGYFTPSLHESYLIGREFNIGASWFPGTNIVGGISNTYIIQDFYRR